MPYQHITRHKDWCSYDCYEGVKLEPGTYNVQVISAIMASLPSFSNEDAMCCFLYDDGDKMFGNCLLPSELVEVIDGDWGVGFAFGNSEVGDGIYYIHPYLHCGISGSGMRGSVRASKAAIRVVHRGKLDLAAVHAETKRALKLALSYGHEMLALMSYARDAVISDLPAFMVAASTEIGLNQADLPGWVRGYHEALEEPAANKTFYGLIQGLMRYARPLKDDECVRVQEAAGRLLAPKSGASESIVTTRVNMISSKAASYDNDNRTVLHLRELFAQRALSGI